MGAKKVCTSSFPPSWMSPYLFVGLHPPRPYPTGQNVVFGKPLKESLKFASVQISTANGNGELYVWGYIPVVVAKSCVPFTLTSVIITAHAIKLRNPRGLYLKEQGASCFSRPCTPNFPSFPLLLSVALSASCLIPLIPQMA